MGDRSIGNGESRHPEHDAEDADDGPREPTHDAAIERETDPDDPRYRPLVPDDDPDAVPPPARPVMSDRTRPPVLRPLPAPRSIRTSRSLWILSFVLGAFGVLLAFLSHAAVTTELTEVIGRLSPTYDESEVATSNCSASKPWSAIDCSAHGSADAGGAAPSRLTRRVTSPWILAIGATAGS